MGLLCAATYRAHDLESEASLKLLRNAAVPLLLSCASGLAQAQNAAPDEAVARRFASVIDAASRRHGVDAALVHAVVFVESSYDPQAVSSQGALGLMQLMPETARRYGVGDPLDPSQNVEGGVRCLKDLLVLFDHDTELALAAYNSGAGAVIRAGYRIPLNAETLAFVPRVLEHYRNHGGAEPPIAEPAFEEQPVAIALEAALAARAPGPVLDDFFDRDVPAPDRGKPMLGILAGRRPRQWRPARIRGTGATPVLLGNAAPEAADEKAVTARVATSPASRRRARAATSGTRPKRAQAR
jgi:hypothetical protein